MGTRTNTNGTTILSHAVVIGLTALIPVPLVDDMVKSYFQRRLVRKLAAANGRHLDPKDIELLADDASGGGCVGCLFGAVVYPFTFLFRKILFFLEMKRSIDTVSINAHRGFLIDHVLRSSWLAPEGRHAAPAVRSAIDYVIKDAPIRPVEVAVRQTFRQSRGVLFAAATLLWNSVKVLTRSSRPDEVSGVLEPLVEQEGEKVRGIVETLQASIDKIPAEHFDKLTSKLAAMLGER